MKLYVIIQSRYNNNFYKGDPMITLNGRKFAANDKEFISSLFETGGTCVGYYKRNKCSVVLSDHNHKRIGIINKYGVLACATELSEITKDAKDKGKYWYSYADIDIIGKYESYMNYIHEMESIINKPINIAQ